MLVSTLKSSSSWAHAPDEYAQEFKTAYDRALNRMTRDFTIRFCNEDGSVKWDELLKFNSGSM